MRAPPLVEIAAPQHQSPAQQRENQGRNKRNEDRIALHPFPGALPRRYWPREDLLSAQPTLEVFGKGTRGGIAAAGFFSEALEANDFEIARHLGLDARRRRRLAHLQQKQHAGGSGGVEGDSTRQKLV